MVGGIALFGVRAPDGRAVDAVVLMPRGILVISSVALPGPALRLDAPLHEPWRADGWTVETTDAAVNPAGAALELAGRVTARLHELHPAGTDARISTVLAVGPYVEHVEQPARELAGSTRVLHPTTTSMLSATVSMPRDRAPLTTTGVRALLRTLGPDAKHPGEDELLAEGFAPAPLLAEPEPAAEYLGAVESTVPTRPPQAETADSPGPVSTSPQQHAEPVAVRSEPLPAESAASAHTSPPADQPGQPRQPGQPAQPAQPAQPRRPEQGHRSRPTARQGTSPDRARRHARRWPAVAALTVLGCVLIAGAVTAMVRSGDSGAPASSTESSTSRQPATEVAGLSFTPRASAVTDTCARHAYGDLRARLDDEDCLRLHRASFTARVDGKKVATTVAVLSFPDRTTAEEFHKLARRPGTGGIDDVATQREQWPGKTPRFSGAAYTTDIHRASVHLVRADWVAETSDADDAALERAAKAALQLPLPD